MCLPAKKLLLRQDPSALTNVQIVPIIWSQLLEAWRKRPICQPTLLLMIANHVKQSKLSAFVCGECVLSNQNTFCFLLQATSSMGAAGRFNRRCSKVVQFAGDRPAMKSFTTLYSSSPPAPCWKPPPFSKQNMEWILKVSVTHDKL